MERVRGIEPPWSAWEAEVLPLNYTRSFCCRQFFFDCGCKYITFPKQVQPLFYSNSKFFRVLLTLFNPAYSVLAQFLLQNCYNLFIIFIIRFRTSLEMFGIRWYNIKKVRKVSRIIQAFFQ